MPLSFGPKIATGDDDNSDNDDEDDHARGGGWLGGRSYGVAA